jgi:hypothetical protein
VVRLRFPVQSKAISQHSHRAANSEASTSSRGTCPERTAQRRRTTSN